MRANSFFIPEIPASAKYYITPRFFAVRPHHRAQFLNRLQMVDPRFDEDLKLPNMPPPRFDASLFEIEDAIISKPSAPILCSTAIFQSHHRKRNQAYWRRYVEDIKNKIDHYAACETIQLRVYIGNSMWEDVTDAGLLKSPNVDFIKMKDSSDGWNIGNSWRLLPLTDYTYDYIYFADCHDRPDLARLSDRILNYPFDDASIFAELVSPPTSDLNYIGYLPQDYFDNFTSHMYHPMVQMIPIESFLKTKIFHWVRGSIEFPFADISKILLDIHNKDSMYQLYDPESDRWTYIQPYAQIYQEADATEKVCFFLSKTVNIKLLLCPPDMAWYQHGRELFGGAFFWDRMIKQTKCKIVDKHLFANVRMG